MNREIRLQAWDPELKIMGEVVAGNWNKSAIGGGVPRWLIRTSDGELIESPMERAAIRRFTGLKDKNGVEIYEGDVLSGRTRYSGTANKKWVNRKGVVFWHESSASFSASPLFFQHHLEDSQLEVIGNIWENPELLEKTK